MIVCDVKHSKMHLMGALTLKTDQILLISTKTHIQKRDELADELNAFGSIVTKFEVPESYGGAYLFFLENIMGYVEEEVSVGVNSTTGEPYILQALRDALRVRLTEVHGPYYMQTTPACSVFHYFVVEKNEQLELWIAPMWETADIYMSNIMALLLEQDDHKNKKELFTAFNSIIPDVKEDAFRKQFNKVLRWQRLFPGFTTFQEKAPKYRLRTDKIR